MAETHINTVIEQDTPLYMSYEEYLAWSGSTWAEWKDGEVIVAMPPKRKHQRLVVFLALLLEEFVRALDLGEIGIAPFEILLTPQGPVREPDVFFIATENLDQLSEDRFLGGPDLAVEIVSNDSVVRDRDAKFDEYEAAGVREYWIIDPRPNKQRADFYTRDDTGRFQPLLPDAQGILHSRVLPGFALHLAWLYADPTPLPSSALHTISRDYPPLAEALRRSQI